MRGYTYVWRATKRGFLTRYRPFIGLDVCHLKNKSGGQLIIAVYRDPNEEYFPLAYAVVEAETNDSWRSEERRVGKECW